MRFLLFLLLAFPVLSIAQEKELISAGEVRTSDRFTSLNGDQNTDQPGVQVKGDKPPITDYLIISAQRDTTHVDTTLHIYKDYKFNYLRKDNFELQPFHNVGQPYNELGKSYSLNTLTPSMGARARHTGYLEVQDMQYYRMPTPLTDLYFKTAVNQGQQLDATFTSNISPQFNFSIGYKGVRSAGDYARTLTSTGIFKFTANYVSKNKKYKAIAHTTFQDLSNQENGGIVAIAVQGFVDNDEDFDDRGRLDPNLENAEGTLNGRRFYINHEYEFLGKKDSTSFYSARLYNEMFYEDKLYRFEQSSPDEEFLGNAFGNAINDKTDFEQGDIEVGLLYDHHLLGHFKAGFTRQAYNYGYNRVLDFGTSSITNRLKGETYQLSGTFSKNYKGFDIQGDGGVILFGDLTGQFLNASASYDFKLFKLSASLDLSSQSPNFNALLFQSDYENYNWQNAFDNIEKQQFSIDLKSDKLLDAQLSITRIQDYVYFTENQLLDSDLNTVGYNAVPQQFDSEITYLKLKLHKGFKFLTHFGMDHTVMLQSVDQNQEVLNLPEVVTRNTFYYENRFFKRALQLQTGFTLKFFTSYNMDGYDPVLGEFYTQNNQEFGDFPMIDVFLNGKIRQTRIFFKAEHINALFGKQDYFSAPLHPYRDFTFRFGIVWNFFL
ncbi:putative porin [Nonlabens tegetincola]|uniref:putative porin n=1 Tax=Nonlabens tegetincola TaxID=323273 RepID=UPI000CF462B0|nr:putative porin [Nonlabens tegetincola]PQJ14117.1 hypothetical protein BST93_12790 [Nonlabens tegetincola]